ncbi:hypothetical protein Cfor_11958 [Coptotermes formosanus]|uniref:Endoplasmic reticulum junction formation protein lunapark n=1 Tax=Coptotermes formosanus TaxID=36987 RepID=A0A6L2PFZ8_COPFO|nr:hypothetical protein Cfor_11958 [Coptotermes formosanus]
MQRERESRKLSIIVYKLLKWTYFCSGGKNTSIGMGFCREVDTVYSVILVKRLVTWYYRRKLTHSQEKLHDMRERKKKLLEDVMDNETYKVAKEILEKFAPDQLQKSSSVVMPTKFSGSPDLSVNQQAALAARNTSTPSSPPTLVSSASSFASLKPGTDVRRRSQQQPPGLVWPPVSWDPARHYTNSGQTNGQGFISRPTGPPMPRPILPRDRSYLDKLVEYLVGDGPSNRYALICKQCGSHNGMALKEEFEYLAFRCCYCFYWNPARKQRPQAPRLPSGSVVSEFSEHGSSSEVESASDTEEECGSDQSHVSESITKEGGIKISEVESGSDQSFVAESTAKEDGMKLSEIAAAEGKVQLEPVSQSTEDKSFTSDTAHTETTES